MAMSKILRIRYETGGRFSVVLDDIDIDVVATDAVNQLAVDAAFERRTKAFLEVDGNKVVRVMSERAPTNGTEPEASGVAITRISTQVGGIVEVFANKDPSDPVGEKQANTRDLVMARLCQSAYTSNHRLMLTLGEDGLTIERVVKSYPGLDLDVTASE
jgi:hypothetical protein